jgi:1-acyl-sn-glycerol-3-phosphate acyltransferase
LLFNVWFFVLTFVCSVLGTFALMISPDLLKRLEGQWVRWNLAGLRVICGIRLELTGRENLPKGEAIFAAQHQSAFDGFVCLLLSPQGAYVVKRELCGIPIFGRLLVHLGHVPVDRTAGATAMRSLLKYGCAALASGRQLMIFPEGTRLAPGERGELQPGVAALASHSGAPVVPVATDSGHCWGRNAFLKQPGTVHVVIRPALPVGLRRPALLAAVQQSWDEGQEMIRESCG